VREGLLLRVAISCAVSVLGAWSSRSEATTSDRPNIVWLTVEDMSPWISCYGDATVPTPHLDRLAREGVVYDNAFATSPACAPARASLITGMFCTRIGTMHMRNGNPYGLPLAEDRRIPLYEGLPAPFVRCFPEHLRATGYACTNNSKKDYQFHEPMTVWDASSDTAHWRDRTGSQPFFAVFNFMGTHESQGFPTAKRRPEAVTPEDVPLPPFYPDTPHVRDALARTYNNIASMDAWVGERIAELEAAGLLDNTVVMFFSDHGVGLPRGKRSCFDTGLRVPLIVRFPQGHHAGTRADRVVSFVDFGPTVLSLAGIDPDLRLDGTPFLGRFARERDDYRRGHAFGNADRFDETYDRSRSVSDGRYRYTRNLLTDIPFMLRFQYREQLPMMADLYALEESGPLRPEQWQLAAKQRPAEEFYDSAADPWEVKNLIDAPEHQERIASLRDRLDAWISDTADLGFVLPETTLVQEKIWPPDGRQPATPPAEIVIEPRPRGDSSVTVVSLTCRDPAASIGYRTSSDGTFSGPWQVFTGPFAAPAGSRLVEVQTHRIGHLPTTVRHMLAKPPNVVVILTDDLGYGDVQCLNPTRGKISTPSIDRLAAQGMTFTDAHSGSSTCTPTRYGLLTGRYAWRTRLQRGVLAGTNDPPLIAADRLTLPGLLQRRGYRTAALGKWHLGYLFADEDPPQGRDEPRGTLAPIGTRVIEGPITRGFDSFIGFSNARTMKMLVKDDRVGEYVDAVEMLPRLASEATTLIRKSAEDARRGNPFFLYLALNSPHTPIVPAPNWHGRSGLNPYADFVMQTDAVVGQLMATLAEERLADDTLIVFTSDNGCSPDADVVALRLAGHHPSGNRRGLKADIWDGGHRVPLIVRWPAFVEPGTESAELVCLTDLVATCAEMVGVSLPATAGEDSVSILPALLGAAGQPLREAVVHHSVDGRLAIRERRWKLALCAGSGGWSQPRDEAATAAGLPPIQLYDMEQDEGEQENLEAEHPDVVERLEKLLRRYVQDGRSTPGPHQPNDIELEIFDRSR
jgi:arylsulfatase A